MNRMTIKLLICNYAGFYIEYTDISTSKLCQVVQYYFALFKIRRDRKCSELV
jgi:hypothetical protein